MFSQSRRSSSEENRGFAHPFVSKCEALKEPLLELSAVAASLGVDLADLEDTLMNVYHRG
jgi:hypothetical protein